MRQPIRAVGSRAAFSTVVASAAVDVCCVLLFVTIGRHTHHDGDSLAGIWHTAWPFLTGLGTGLVLTRYWRRPRAIWPAGIGAWVGAAGAGMVIRLVAGQGTEAAFIVVAAAFLALFLLGWRCAGVAGSYLWRKSHSSAPRA
jgi:Protein of unknown function (DUF3054)